MESNKLSDLIQALASSGSQLESALDAIPNLVRSLDSAGREASSRDALQSASGTSAAADLLRGLDSSSLRRGVSDVQQLAEAVPSAAAAQELPASTRSTASKESDSGSVVSTVLKTAGLVTGVGPIVTGLFKLFGSSSPEPPPALIPYQMPGSVSVEAGLSSDRSFVPVSYGSSGLARATNTLPNTSANQPAQIQVNVNAMDSRSFLDHSDEIARAVREAMLRSHSLNDVVSEI